MYLSRKRRAREANGKFDEMHQTRLVHTSGNGVNSEAQVSVRPTATSNPQADCLGEKVTD